MGFDARKPVFGVCEQQKCRATWASAQTDPHFLIHFLEGTISKLARGEISIFKLVTAADENDFSHALSETPKTGFVVSRAHIIFPPLPPRARGNIHMYNKKFYYAAYSRDIQVNTWKICALILFTKNPSPFHYKPDTNENFCSNDEAICASICRCFTPSQQFFSYVEMFSCLSGLKSTKQWIKCLAQGHNTVPPVSISP